jgi:hypothetical protein
MKFPKFSKNNLSGAIFLLLVILLSQTSILDMLFNTTLGRLSLVSLILGAGYLNKFMGIAAVLIAVVMFSSFGNVFEGMDDMTQKKQLIGKDLVGNLTELVDAELEDKKKELEEKKEENKVEGFDIIGKERTMQLGMKSKQANNSRQTGGNVMPHSISDTGNLPFSNF